MVNANTSQFKLLISDAHDMIDVIDGIAKTFDQAGNSIISLDLAQIKAFAFTLSRASTSLAEKLDGIEGAFRLSTSPIT